MMVLALGAMHSLARTLSVPSAAIVMVPLVVGLGLTIGLKLSQRGRRRQLSARRTEEIQQRRKALPQLQAKVDRARSAQKAAAEAARVSMAAYAEQRGHEVYIHDCLGPRAPVGAAKTAERILEQQPDIVGFLATTSAFLDGYAVAELIKQARPEVTTIFGGVHVSAL